MKILDISSQDLAPGNTESFFDIFNSIDDFPVMTRPYSNITHHIIKDEKDSNNPYQVITKNAELLHKLIHLHQYGVSTQPIDRDTLYIHNHSRYEHSLDTALNIELIMRNNGFSEADIRKGIVA